MKRIALLILVALLSATSVQAHGGGGFGWFAPFLIGGAIGYAASRPEVVYDRPQTVIVNQPTTFVPTNTPIYQERWQYFPSCNCERKVLVRIQ